MKSITSVCAALTCAWALTVVPLAAQGHGKGQGAATPIVHAKPHSAATASAHASAPASKSASASRTQAGPKPKPPKPATPATAAAKGPKSNPHTSSQHAVKPMTVQQHLAKQPQLSAKLGTLLPGMDVSQAATGFKNLGAFVSAVHVSRNLGIPFLSLKSRLTGPNPQSLGQAIQALKPNAIVEKEVQRARAQSRADLKDESEKH